ncbi:hypothetical protein, partial [Vibrio metschnikovii]|uniref:hypothetical protein n=1 Tax=Vibrio metschnikovii TaxID=28172 RepID=UPI002FC93729
MTISNEADLGEALKREQDTIEIEGDLKNKVLKIKATGKVAWAVLKDPLINHPAHNHIGEV